MVLVRAMVLAPEALLDEVCCDDPDRVAVALQVSHGRGDELVPGIVARLERLLADPAAHIQDDAPFVGFLLYLAAEFKATATHALIARVLRLGEDPVDRLLGDVTTSGGGPILAETYDGDPGSLIGLIEDAAAGPFERGAGLFALAILVRRTLFPRQELLAFMIKLAANLDPERESDSMVANQLVENAVRLHAHEIRGTIMGLYERGLADEDFFESDYSGAALEPDAPPAREAAALDHHIDDAWAALKGWAFFTEERYAPPDSEADAPLPPAPEEPFRERPYTPPVPYRAPPKVGRNEPCPCGSGKKFKKCCGR